MSRENVETLRRCYEHWGEGDWSEPPIPLYDAHVVYISQENEPEPGPHYGLDAFSDYFRRFLASWDDLRIEASEFREQGDSVVVRVYRSAVGRESGLPIGDEAFHVWTFRGGRVIRMEVFIEEAEALEVVGLSE